MPEPLTTETANVIVVVRMADDIRHLLGRVAAVAWAVAAFFVLATAMDLWDHDWVSAAFSALGIVGFGLTGHETWARRAKYAAFARRTA